MSTHSFLLNQLVQREIKARYKQSLIGYLWVALNPVAQLLVFSFVFSYIIRFPEQAVPYPVFLYAGLLPWTLFHTSVTATTQSLVDNAGLLRKVRFPREFIPYSVIIAKLLDFFISFILLLLLMLIMKVPLTLGVLAIPFLLVIQVVFTAGISLFLSAANLLYRDVQHLIALILMLWMYLTPVVYPLSLVPNQYRFLYHLNPLVGIIEGYRSLLFGMPLRWDWLTWSLLLSVVSFGLGKWFFHRMEKIFADVV